MGLFDTLKQGALNEVQKLAGEHGPAAQKLAGLLQSSEQGGLSGIVQILKDKGLGNIVSSWISTGQNLPVSAAQIQSALGPERIAAIASKLGIPAEQAHEKLAQWLPTIIDKLTPNGQLPSTSKTS